MKVAILLVCLLPIIFAAPQDVDKRDFLLGSFKIPSREYKTSIIISNRYATTLVLSQPWLYHGVNGFYFRRYAIGTPQLSTKDCSDVNHVLPLVKLIGIETDYTLMSYTRYIKRDLKLDLCDKNNLQIN